MTPVSKARTHTAASIAPAAPSRCPVAIEGTVRPGGIVVAPGENTRGVERGEQERSDGRFRRASEHDICPKEKATIWARSFYPVNSNPRPSRKNREEPDFGFLTFETACEEPNLADRTEPVASEGVLAYMTANIPGAELGRCSRGVGL